MFMLPFLFCRSQGISDLVSSNYCTTGWDVIAKLPWLQFCQHIVFLSDKDLFYSSSPSFPLKFPAFYQVQKEVRRRNLSLKKIVLILIKSQNANHTSIIPVLVCTALQKLASPQLPVLLYYWNICRVGCFSQCHSSMLRKVLYCERTVSEEPRAYVLNWSLSIVTFCWGLVLFGKVVLLR